MCSLQHCTFLSRTLSSSSALLIWVLVARSIHQSPPNSDPSLIFFFSLPFWISPAWHRGLPGPSGPEPQKSPKRVRKGGEPQSPQRVRPGVRKESKKSPKLRFWTLFGLRGALFGDSGAPRGRRPRDNPFGLFSDSFGAPGPKGPGALCARRGGS